MALSKLKLNPDQSEFIVLDSKAQHQKLSSHFPVNIFGNRLHPGDIVLSQNTFRRLVNPVSTRWVTFVEVAVLAANPLVSSHMDYYSSLFIGLSCYNQHELQSIQNTFACIVTNKNAHVAPIIKLHPS